MNEADVVTWQARLAAAGLHIGQSADDHGAGDPGASGHSASDHSAVGQGTTPPAELPPMGWAVRLLAGIGGFIGGVMILGFFGFGIAALNLFKSSATAFTIGLLLCAAAVSAYRAAAESVAGQQFGLAVSIAGQIALAIAIADWFKAEFSANWWPLVLLQAVLLVLISNSLHRTLVTAAMVILGALACKMLILVTVWWALVALGAVWWLHAEGRLLARGAATGDAVAPIAFGALAGLILMQWPQWFVIWGRLDGPGGFPWHWAAAWPALLLAVWLQVRQARPAQRAAVLALAAAAGALGIWLPAWTVALLLAVLGLTSARPGWAVLAALAMIWSVSRFYYHMHITLLEKAAWMAAAGLVCLLLAALVYRIAPRLAAPIDNSHTPEAA